MTSSVLSIRDHEGTEVRIDMAAVSNGRKSVCSVTAMDSPIIETQQNGGIVDRLKILYPIVNEEETPLPRAWSAKDKYNYIGLSQNNLRVHYKGHGKTHKDAASVRATHPIPPACGLYYFEVKIISKGRDGYMGVGLSAQGVNMNRLPGWDKNSYGYHGDDGHSFCSSGTGQPYGPTFTTGDVIGCGVNLIDNTCFYTKNGHHLGIAFTDLPPNLYPTVGLQTPGEVVDANFGQQPFVFDIEDMMRELRARTRLSILEYPVPESQGEWQAILHKMVSTYLVHHGYCATAEAFAQSTGQAFNEEVTSIKNRQRILKLILAGRMGEAIELTSRLYPGLLEHNQNLLFMLKCRQFVEMVNGSDSEVCPPRCPRGLASYQSTLLFNNNNTTNTTTTTNSNNCNNSQTNQRPNSPIQTSVIQSTKTYTNNTNNTNNNNSNKNNKNNGTTSSSSSSSTTLSNPSVQTTTVPLTLEQQQQQSTLLNQHQHHQNNTLNGNSTSVTTSESITTSTSSIAPVVSQTNNTSNTPPPIVSKSPSSNSVGVSQQQQIHEDSDIEMETTSSDDTQNGHSTTPINSSSSNGKISPVTVDGDGGDDHQSVVNNTGGNGGGGGASHSSQSTTNGYQNGNSHKSTNNIIYDEDEDMDVDLPLSRRQLCGGSKPAVERMLEFGRELYNMSQRLRQEQGKCERNKKMLRDAFSLLAYSNPWASPVGWQLDPMQRETVCASLNSAILESSDLPRRPPLEVTIAHAQELVRLMSGSGLGSCAFASVDDILQH